MGLFLRIEKCAEVSTVALNLGMAGHFTERLEPGNAGALIEAARVSEGDSPPYICGQLGRAFSLGAARRQGDAMTALSPPTAIGWVRKLDVRAHADGRFGR